MIVYRIRDRLPWGIFAVAILILTISGCQFISSNYTFKGTEFESPIAIVDFELTDGDNQPFRLQDVEGNITLIFFGYTFCPDVCPFTLVDVRNALTDLDNRDKVKVIFISVDPERDSPEVLKGYLSSFDPDFIGLTGDYGKIKSVMKLFGAYSEKAEVSNSAAGYLVSHTARLYLLNPRQELIISYPFGFESDDLRSDLVYLLQQP